MREETWGWYFIRVFNTGLYGVIRGLVAFGFFAFVCCLGVRCGFWEARGSRVWLGVGFDIWGGDGYFFFYFWRDVYGILGGGCESW